MDPLLALAALLTAGIAVAHSYLGERYILVRLFRRPDLPKLFGSDWFTKRTLRFAWHITSIAWLGLAAALFVEPRIAVSAAFAASALVSLVGARGRHYSWAVFGAIAALTWPW
ncbi:MAG TPA: hypothetical protein VM582_04565 [Candidatus Thermoplasmatota archaeon]|nr:hypothetical protein [Candidatus Thermoplasmatota archaeon]